MQRRQFLAVSATVTAGVFAGCSVPGGGGEEGGEGGGGREEGDGEGGEGGGGGEGGEEGGEDSLGEPEQVGPQENP